MLLDMPITIGSNIAALGAQRRLGNATDQLTAIFERLSSGQRINRASDDAAGLAISATLSVNTKIATKGILNINDGIGMLNIADGALSVLTTIAERQLELAEQAASGTFSSSQRSMMQKEVTALNSEFNRIIQSTKFSTLSVLSNPDNPVVIQAGVSTIGVTTGYEIATRIGNGTYNTGTTAINGYAFKPVQLADFNEDGNTDILDTADGVNFVQVQISNGDGTFRISSLTGSINSGGTIAADFNGDGHLDILSGYTGGKQVAYGNGDGTFRAGVTVVNFGASQFLYPLTADFNSDGRLDFFDYDQAAGRMMTALQNGDGTFAVAMTATTLVPFVTGDFNNDGKPDLILSNNTGTYLASGNGNGTFAFNNFLGMQANNIYVSDQNGDDKQDLIIVDNTNSIYFIQGNGDGSFKAPISYAAPNTAYSGITGSSLVDVNADGVKDYVYTRTSVGAGILLGNADGSFKAAISVSSTNTSNLTGSIAVGNFNSDSIPDILLSHSVGPGYAEILTGIATSSVVVQSAINISTQSAARTSIGTLQTWLTNLGKEKGINGTNQSRLSTALNFLHTTRENLFTAASRILDADIAQETSLLLSTQIKQKCAASVLSQANLNPQLALLLLQ